jgi:hypothetical protein
MTAIEPERAQSRQITSMSMACMHQEGPFTTHITPGFAHAPESAVPSTHTILGQEVADPMKGNRFGKRELFLDRIKMVTEFVAEDRLALVWARLVPKRPPKNMSDGISVYLRNITRHRRRNGKSFCPRTAWPDLGGPDPVRCVVPQERVTVSITHRFW